VNLPGGLAIFNAPLDGILTIGDAILSKIMWIFIILGVVLSCMHQSSLGSLMLIAPTKLHPLWYTPILPLLFLTSAFAVGYPMVVVETTIASASFKLDSEIEILAPLTRITVFLLGIYMVLKIGDMVVRGTYVYLFDGTYQTNSFLVEIVLGVIVPWIMLVFEKIRRSRRCVFIAGFLVVAGVVLNRINVFIVGFRPPLSENGYFPATGEMLVTFGLIATLMFIYRIVVTYLPVLPESKEVSS
jgi:Ni/Fe-hydrogenase subunit HybB-like protein